MTAIESVAARGRARSIFRGGRPGAFIAAGLLILAAAALSPASAAVTCADAWEQGTLDANGEWQAGAGNDYRVACTADMDGDAVVVDTLPAFPDGADRYVIDVSDANIDRVSGSIANAESRHLVLTGTLDTHAMDNVEIEITGFAPGHEDARLVLESFAAIAASGANNDGIRFANMEMESAHTGTVKAINRGTIAASGEGARGMSARAVGAGAAAVENAGTVVTRGGATGRLDTAIRSDGVYAESERGDATAGNLAGGSVATHGVAAYGVGARAVGGGNATVTNAGTVDTHAAASNDDLLNDAALADTGARGLWASAAPGIIDNRSGDATVENASTGAVTTRGAHGFGAIAVIGNGNPMVSATATVRNRGAIRTEGPNADAAIALATWGGDFTNPNEARAYNHEGATIVTMGDGSGGLGALIQSGSRSSGSTFVRNDGTIFTAGEDAWGMNASFVEDPLFTTVTITDTGDVTAENTGTITVEGPGAQGIRAVAYGEGEATVLVDGGKVYATHDDTDDDEDGVGIHAASGEDGKVTVTIRNRAEIDAPQAMRFPDGTATVTVDRSVIKGRMWFGEPTDALSDTLTVTNSVLRGDIATGGSDDTIRASGAVTMEGDIDFGLGDDTLNLDVTGASVLRGDITGLETLNKTSAGDFTIDGDVTFAGSSVVVSEGGLVVTGHMNLGTDGTVTVEDGARLTALLTVLGIPRITADMTTVEEGGTVLVQADGRVAAVNAERAVVTFLEDANVQGTEPLPVHTQDGDGPTTMLAAFDPTDGSATVADGAEVGTRAQDAFLDDHNVLTRPATSLPSRGGGGGGSDDTAAFVIGGASLLALLYAVWDWDELMSVSPATLNPALVRTVDRPSGLWVRSLAESLPRRGAGAASGTEIGVDFAVGSGFVLGVSAVPDAAVDHASAGADATTFAGGRYTLKGGWRGEALFGGLKLSQARWGVDSAYRNPTVGGGLRSRYRASQTDAQASLGARFDLGAGLALTPLAGAFAGAVKHGAHRAEGPVFDAAMPEVVQRYGGWRIGLGLASEWRDGPGNLKLRPSLKLSAARVWTDSPEFTLRQSDRLGILSTATRARLPAAPGTVLGVATGLDTVAADGVRLGVGYGGLAMDGKLVHAAFARAKITF